jgi:hypothetical protein
MSDITKAIEVCKFTTEEIDEAVEGLDGLQQLIVPFLKSQNYENMGEQDAKDCEKHLMMGKHALILLQEALDVQKAAQAVRDNPLTCEGCKHEKTVNVVCPFCIRKQKDYPDKYEI